MKTSRLICVLPLILCCLFSIQASYAGSDKNTESLTSQQSQRLDLNTATLADFEALPGVGKKKAKAIVEYRKRVGGFLEVEQLTQVKGIGEKLLNKLQHKLEVK